MTPTFAREDDRRFYRRLERDRAHLREVLPLLRWRAELGPRPERRELRFRIAEVERRLEDIRACIHHMTR